MAVEGTSTRRGAVAPRPIRWEGHGGVELAGDVRGTGSPAVLLHGGGQTRHSWGLAADRIAAQGRRAVTVDLRGHGDSEHAPDGDYSTEAYVGDLLALVDVLKAPAALVGASLGGLTALTAVGESPGGGVELASALVLVDVAPRIEEGGAGRIRDFMTAYPEGFADLEEVADAVERYLPGRSRPKDVSGLSRNLRRRADGRYRWHWDPQIMSSDPSSGRAARQERMVRAARRVRVPTLLVRGEHSDVLSPQGAAEFLELTPHAEYVEVPGAGHMVAGDANDPFTAAIVGFLDRHR